jgi:hypothetical protein
LLGGSGLFLSLGLVALATLGTAREKDVSKKVIRQDRVIAGGPKEFMEVRHLVLEGTNREIGKALATIGKERYRLQLEASRDRFRSGVQRRYIEKNYPILFERMRGVAAAFGKRVEDDKWDFTALGYLLGLPSGCSVVYYPPGVMSDGKAVVSRNYEYATGTLLDARPKPGELPVNARPYLIEMHPDRGYPSLALCAYPVRMVKGEAETTLPPRAGPRPNSAGRGLLVLLVSLFRAGVILVRSAARPALSLRERKAEAAKRRPRPSPPGKSQNGGR